MKVSKRAFIFVIFLTLATLACQALNNLGQPALTGKDLYLKQRTDALATKPEALGIKVDPNSNAPYGVMMDNMLDGSRICTLISFASGDASLICDSGNGRTDGIKFQKVEVASKKFVDAAAIYVGKTELTADYPLPTKVGNIIFYIITPSGVYTTKEKNQDEVIHSFLQLYMAGQDVITAFRLSDH